MVAAQPLSRWKIVVTSLFDRKRQALVKVNGDAFINGPVQMVLDQPPLHLSGSAEIQVIQIVRFRFSSHSNFECAGARFGTAFWPVPGTNPNIDELSRRALFARERLTEVH